jgi:superfamily II DNA/RNA helicase
MPELNTPTAPEAATASLPRFDDFGLAPPILQALADQGYQHPTPIQAQAIPVVLQGRDVMGAAQTGTGKTAGFSLPIIQQLLPQANTSASPARHPVRALILTPTRELADQVSQEIRRLARAVGNVKVVTLCGGVALRGQVLSLEHGAHVVVMGCAGMAQYRQPLEDALGVPVVEPTQAAAGMALVRVQLAAAAA